MDITGWSSRIERALDVTDISRGDMGVNLCRLEALMTEESLDVPDVRSLLKKVRCETVAEGMGRYARLDACAMRRAFDNVLHSLY